MVIFHNLPTSYRLQWFQHILRDPDLDVRIFLTGRPRSNRPYWVDAPEFRDGRVTALRGLGFPLKGLDNDRYNINPGLLRVLDGRPDVVMLFGYAEPTNLAVAMLCRLRGIPYILSAEVSDVWGQSLTGRISMPLVKRVVRNAAGLAPASTTCARFFESLGGNRESMSIIPCVPDVEPLRRARESLGLDASIIKDRLNLKGMSIVLFVGRLHDYKGVREAIEALGIVRRSRPDVVMVIVGSGPLGSYVEEMSRQLAPNLMFLGTVDDATLRDLYLASDIHIMPSWHEAFGVVCAEALGYGVPSIVTRTSGCSDLVTDGENGYIINPGDAQELAHAIIVSLSDPIALDRMKKLAFSKSEDFSMSIIMARLKRLIHEVAERSRVSR
ncbi:MAG: glycosyltransferase family 4 protein [Candidatus Thermoplasmatota archaeon]